MNTTRGREFIGFVIFKLMNGLPNAVNSRGAVSPAIRDMAISIPVTMPLNPAGTITFKIVL